ncbi:hypothetical protein ADIARSV_0903 [Arcticibacter svalbardensis MN12-7]|uniref:Uncharacterized protein n=1 Tax=Arcticibacter svalbardensis MN12-7 TaxID=1150600 RepID=R9GWH8_9SPHI|nr:hypothetical protein ADIARSV_0903 [Arcticibacter svalbardensis MN12-7]
MQYIVLNKLRFAYKERAEKNKVISVRMTNNGKSSFERSMNNKMEVVEFF